MSLIKSNKRRSPMLGNSLLSQDPFFSDFLTSRRGLMNILHDDSEKDFEFEPAMNVKENKNEYEIDLAVPGLEKDDFKITIEEGILTIAAEKEIKSEEEKEGFMRKEFSYNSFSRSISLPENVDENQDVKAKCKGGILKLKLYKKEEMQPRISKSIKVT